MKNIELREKALEHKKNCEYGNILYFGDSITDYKNKLYL